MLNWSLWGRKFGFTIISNLLENGPVYFPSEGERLFPHVAWQDLCLHNIISWSCGIGTWIDSFAIEVIGEFLMHFLEPLDSASRASVCPCHIPSYLVAV